MPGIIDLLIERTPVGIPSAYDEAIELQKVHNLGAPSQEGPADALRHMYASALIAQRGGKITSDAMGSIFEELTRVFGPPTYTKKGETPEEALYAYRMDMHNNALGSEIGSKTDTPEEALNMILDKMRQSTEQVTQWDGPSDDQGLYDDAFPVIWNRQHYADSPEQTKAKLDSLTAADFLR